MMDFGEENLGERDHLEDLGVDGSIILRLYLKETGWDIVDWEDLARVRENLNSFKHENKFSDFIKYKECLEQLRN